jgi:hypothetical protein
MRARSVLVAAVVAAVSLGLPATSFAAADATNVKAKLKGANEVPGPGDPNAKGTFKGKIDGDQLCYTFKVRKVARVSAAHIHVGDAETAGPVAVQLMNPTKKGVSDCITAVPDDQDTTQTLSQSELAGILADPSGYYVNVHNDKYPSGALRGQLK